MTGLDTRLAPIKAFILEKREFSYQDIQDKFNKSTLIIKTSQKYLLKTLLAIR